LSSSAHDDTTELFRTAAVTGYDLPSLLERDGQSLKDDVGVESGLHRKQIMRAITMKLLGVADGAGLTLLLTPCS
jgi:hypothetical protein